MTNNTEACPDWFVLMHGYLDGELDAAHSLTFEQHLATCDNCAKQLEGFQSIRRAIGQDGVRWATPHNVREQVLAAISLEQSHASAKGSSAREGFLRHFVNFIKRWSYIPSLAAIAASAFLIFMLPGADTSLQDAIVASHVQSLLVDHLTDVQTSDQHTVKPWFNGKIDYSPPVVDLAAQGFPLLGGRVDYIHEKVVSVLVYRRHGHIINLFVWPGAGALSADASHDGYNIVKWSENGLTYWAVSDVSPADLTAFRQNFSEVAGRLK